MGLKSWLSSYASVVALAGFDVFRKASREVLRKNLEYGGRGDGAVSPS